MEERDGDGRKAVYLKEIRIYGVNPCSWMKPVNPGQRKQWGARGNSNTQKKRMQLQ